MKGDSMDFQDYQKLAKTTDNEKAGVAMVGLGLAGEVGEVVELLKKALYHGRPMDLEKLRSELGDVMWYVTVLASRYGLTMEGIAKRNIAKLKARYPDGFELGGGRR